MDVFPSFTTFSIINHESFFSPFNQFTSYCMSTARSIWRWMSNYFLFLQCALSNHNPHTDSITSHEVREASRDFFFHQHWSKPPIPLNSTQQQLMWVSVTAYGWRGCKVCLRVAAVSPPLCRTTTEGSYSVLMHTMVHKFRSCSATLNMLGLGYKTDAK